MKVRVYLRRNLTKLAGAVASGSIKLAPTRTFSRDVLRNDGLSLAETFCCRILIGKYMCRGLYISMFIKM